MRERKYTVMKPVYTTTNLERKYTVMKPVVATEMRERKYTVMKPVYTTTNVERKYTVMKPVVATETRERRYTVLKPVYQTSVRETRYTVMRPVTTTQMVTQPYTVRKPVTTVSEVVRECGRYETQYTTVPGPIVERRVKVPRRGMRLRNREDRLFPQEKSLCDGCRAVPAPDRPRTGVRLEAGRRADRSDSLRRRDGLSRGCRPVVSDGRRGTRPQDSRHDVPDGRRGTR